MTFQLPLIVLLGIGVLWKGIDLARAPRDRVLRLLVVCLLLLLGGEILSIPGINSAIDRATLTGAGKVAFNAIYMSGLCSLNLFFASSVRGVDGAYRRHLRSNTGLLCGVLITLVAAMAATPAALRGHSLSTPYMAEPPIALFYLVGNVYFLYAYLAAGRWALRYARKAAQHLGAGLRITAVGLLGLAVTSVNRIILVALRFHEPGSHEVFNAVNWSLSDWAMGVTLVGICYSAFAQVLTRVRSAARHRRMYHELTPLWTTLTTAYPELVLKEPQTGARWRRPGPHRTHEQRFCRRVIECRDGLVCLSPYLAHVASETDLAHAPAEELARHIREALALKPAMESARTELSAVRVAVPPNGDLEADARALIAVSRALQKGSHEQGTDLRGPRHHGACGPVDR